MLMDLFLFPGPHGCPLGLALRVLDGDDCPSRSEAVGNSHENFLSYNYMIYSLNLQKQDAAITNSRWERSHVIMRPKVVFSWSKRRLQGVSYMSIKYNPKNLLSWQPLQISSFTLLAPPMDKRPVSLWKNLDFPTKW